MLATSGFEVGNITKVWYATLNWVVPTSGFVANAAFTQIQYTYQNTSYVNMHATHIGFSPPSITLMKMDISNVFPDTQTRAIPHAMPLPSAHLARLLPRHAPCATGLKIEKGREFVTFPNKTLARHRRTALLIIWHFNIVLPFEVKIKGVIKLVKGDGGGDQ